MTARSSVVRPSRPAPLPIRTVPIAAPRQSIHRLTPEQVRARRELGYRAETQDEREEREREERIVELIAMRLDRTQERRRIAVEELGEYCAYLLTRVLELEQERDSAVQLAAQLFIAGCPQGLREE